MKGRNKITKKGFTIVEVVLFLGITGAILVGIMAGTSTAIARQRYNDSVQDFTEFLRRTYSETVNVQNVRIGSLGDSYSCTLSGMVDESGRLIGSDDNSWTRWTSTGDPGGTDGYPGRSGCAVYGRLITFGENGEETIRSYDIIGRTMHSDVNTNMSTMQALKEVAADIITIHVENNGRNAPECVFAAAGNTNRYILQWQAKAETTAADRQPFVGTVMIVRSPITGTIHTYVMEGTAIGANDVITNKDNRYSLNISGSNDCKGELANYHRAMNEGRLLSKYLSTEYFKPKEIDICVGSTDLFAVSGLRRNIRLVEDGRNATAVELVAQDLSEAEGGNRCK